MARRDQGLRLAATCALGLEPLLRSELERLGVGALEELQGAVRFRGSWPDVWRANLWLRTANRVLVEVARFRIRSDRDLYHHARSVLEGDEVAGLPTRELFAPERTLAVFATTSRSRLRDSRWVALKVKDALVDAQRQRFRRRSSIDTKRPEVPIRVLVQGDDVRLFLDSSREPLDRRGYRKKSGAAPVREQLAAACVLASGWDGSGPVVDPMCGTGTLLVEAAWIGLERAPGALRKRWVFERWPGFDRDAFRRLPRGPRDGSAPDAGIRWLGIDSSELAVRAARNNLAAAGLESSASVRLGDGFGFDPPEGPGLVVVNPPYGKRVEDANDLWPRLGDLFKQRYAGWKAVVLAGDEARGGRIGLRPARRIPVRAGKIDVRILPFDLYSGSRRASASDQESG